MAYVQKDHLNNDKNENLVRNARQASQHHEPDFEVVPRVHRLFCAGGEQRDESARAADAETVVDCWRRALKQEIVKEMFTHGIRNINKMRHECKNITEDFDAYIFHILK